MEKNVFYSKVNLSVSAVTRGLTGWKSFFFFTFDVTLNLEYFCNDERQQCPGFGYFTYKHIPMKVLPDYFENNGEINVHSINLIFL